MSSDADRFWEGLAKELRQAKGFSIPTPEEAEAELDAVADEPLTEKEQAVASLAQYYGLPQSVIAQILSLPEEELGRMNSFMVIYLQHSGASRRQKRLLKHLRRCMERTNIDDQGHCAATPPLREADKHRQSGANSRLVHQSAN
jgi:hypothetical protein